jgi:hypothetical protein
LHCVEMRALSLLTLAVAASLFDGVHTWSVAQIHKVSLHGRHTAAVHSAVRLRTCPGACSPRPFFTPPVRSRAFSMAPLEGVAKNVDEHTPSQEPGAALMAKLGEVADQDKRQAMLRENFQQCDEAAMAYLGAKLQSGERGNWQALLVDLQELMQERLEAGKDLLMNLLASGEINVLDRKIVEKVKNGECDPSFLNVLQINLQDAEANAAKDDPQVASRSGMNLQALRSIATLEAHLFCSTLVPLIWPCSLLRPTLKLFIYVQRLQVLVHIYTRVQEELEKLLTCCTSCQHALLAANMRY